MPDIQWRCSLCARDLDGNPRQCPWCGYTVYEPIRGQAPDLSPVKQLSARERVAQAWDGNKSRWDLSGDVSARKAVMRGLEAHGLRIPQAAIDDALRELASVLESEADRG